MKGRWLDKGHRLLNALDSRPKMGLNRDMMRIVAPSDDSLDINEVEFVTGVLPVAGVIESNEETLVPTVFVHFEGHKNDGTDFQHVFSFHPAALASAANLFSAVSLLVLTNPDVMVNEIAEKEGINKYADSKIKTYGSGAYI